MMNAAPKNRKNVTIKNLCVYTTMLALSLMPVVATSHKPTQGVFSPLLSLHQKIRNSKRRRLPCFPCCSSAGPTVREKFERLDPMLLDGKIISVAGFKYSVKNNFGNWFTRGVSFCVAKSMGRSYTHWGAFLKVQVASEFFAKYKCAYRSPDEQNVAHVLYDFGDKQTKGLRVKLLHKAPSSLVDLTPSKKIQLGGQQLTEYRYVEVRKEVTLRDACEHFEEKRFALSLTKSEKRYLCQDFLLEFYKFMGIFRRAAASVNPGTMTYANNGRSELDSRSLNRLYTSLTRTNFSALGDAVRPPK